jgi:hypothetical protein
MRRSVEHFLVRVTGVILVTALALASPGIALAADTLRVTGTVTSQTGGGVQNVSVTATAPGGTTALFGPVLTAANGSYQLDVNPGT